MNIELHLIDIRSPRGFTMVVPANRRLMVQPNESMENIAERVVAHCGSRLRIDVLRIECHGIVHSGFAFVTEIEFGFAMNESTVEAFRLLRPLWSQESTPPDFMLHPSAYRNVIPRIEFHGCGPVPALDNMLHALAEAAYAPVFASTADQDVNAGGDAYALEGPIYRFNPTYPMVYAH